MPAGARFEAFRARDEGIGYMDLCWPAVCIVEMKAPEGESPAGHVDCLSPSVADTGFQARLEADEVGRTIVEGAVRATPRRPARRPDRGGGHTPRANRVARADQASPRDPRDVRSGPHHHQPRYASIASPAPGGPDPSV